MTGILIWDQGRPDISLDTGFLYGGLHCGDCFRCLVDDTWLDVRLEYSDDWVLIHGSNRVPICYGTRVQL